MNSSFFWGIVIILSASIMGSVAYWVYTEPRPSLEIESERQAIVEREPSPYVNDFLDKLQIATDEQSAVQQNVTLPNNSTTGPSNLWNASEFFGDFNRQDTRTLSGINWEWDTTTKTLTETHASSSNTINSFVFSDKCTDYIRHCVDTTNIAITDSLTQKKLTQGIFSISRDLEGREALALSNYSTEIAQNIAFDFPLYPLGTCEQGESQTVNGVTMTCTNNSMTYTFPQDNPHMMPSGTQVSSCKQVDLSWQNGVRQETIVVCPQYGLVNSLTI